MSENAFIVRKTYTKTKLGAIDRITHGVEELIDVAIPDRGQAWFIFSIILAIIIVYILGESFGVFTEEVIHAPVGFVGEEECKCLTEEMSAFQYYSTYSSSLCLFITCCFACILFGGPTFAQVAEFFCLDKFGIALKDNVTSGFSQKGTEIPKSMAEVSARTKQGVTYLKQLKGNVMIPVIVFVCILMLVGTITGTRLGVVKGQNCYREHEDAPREPCFPTKTDQGWHWSMVGYSSLITCIMLTYTIYGIGYYGYSLIGEQIEKRKAAKTVVTPEGNIVANATPNNVEASNNKATAPKKTFGSIFDELFSFEFASTKKQSS